MQQSVRQQQPHFPSKGSVATVAWSVIEKKTVRRQLPSSPRFPTYMAYVAQQVIAPDTVRRQCGVDSHLTEDCPVASGKTFWVEAMERAIGTCADHVAEACNKVFCETPPKLRDRIVFGVRKDCNGSGGFTLSITLSMSDPVESGAVAVSDAVAVSCKRPTQRGGGQKKKGAATTVAVTATAAAAANSLAKGA